MMRIAFTVLLSMLVLASCKEKVGDSQIDRLTDYVDPFVGTDGPGNTYPGAVVPFGMVQLSPDNGLPGWDRISGYFWQDSTIAGFSHKHLTGTGAGDLYDVLIFPYNSRFTNDLWPDQENYRPFSYFSHEQETAAPGYYGVELLSSGISVELTATERVGMHRYTFPKDKSSKILIDLGYKLNWDKPTKTYLKQENDTTIVGYRYSTGWAPDQREYFVIQLSQAIQDVDFYVNNEQVNAREVRSDNTKAELNFITKEGQEILIKVAMSSHSIDGARKNLEAECSHWDFDLLVSEAQAKWEKQLSSIIIQGSDYQKRVFYTNLYHCFLTPSLHADVDGWYKGADGKKHQAVGYDKYDTFSLWDTYRTAHPLYTLFVPDRVKDMISSFMSHYNETGLLPVWSFVGNETNMMIAYHSVPVIVDAFFKGIPMDAEKAYQACKTTAMSDAWSLKTYKRYGYIPADDDEKGHWSVSKTLEYAYDDWCIAQFAQALGKTDDYKLFTERANYWKNLYDPESTFFRPKTKDGQFVKDFIPRAYTEYFCESNAWHYVWHVQHDIPGLIDLIGQEAFTAKLDSMFSYDGDVNDTLPIFSTGMIGQYAHGNEPSHHVAYLYNQVGQSHKTQDLVHQIINTQYSDQPDGYCGNEDCGQMSAWLVMASLGIYPVNPADGMYHLSTPWVSRALLALPNGKQLTISCEDADAETLYIDKVLLNGKELDALTISHQQLLKGGDLIFVRKGK